MFQSAVVKVRLDGVNTTPVWDRFTVVVDEGRAVSLTWMGLPTFQLLPSKDWYDGVMSTATTSVTLDQGPASGRARYSQPVMDASLGLVHASRTCPLPWPVAVRPVGLAGAERGVAVTPSEAADAPL